MATSDDLEKQALVLADQAKAIAITSPESYTSAWDFLKKLKSMERSWEDHNAPVVSSAHTTWKAAVAARDKLLKPFQEAERFVKGLIGAYDTEQERIRQATEKTLQDDATLAAAQSAQENGDATHADAILNGEAPVAPVILRKETPKIAGGSIRQNWKGRCLDLARLVRAVADGKAPITLLMVNQSALDQYAKATKEGFNISGCQAYTEQIVSATKA